MMGAVSKFQWGICDSWISADVMWNGTFTKDDFQAIMH